ncbi:hypothetical protein T4D_13857 [Trichinella pseudospiralis]|uniref:Uncharacterized protein n=1 Tax=Trichinella pseudospiralis TaxID=6337 RepID=A0A0V1G1Q9_TRIPS|nr:hypothetical protein T4D_13857 [Trichinella pseudospiralis]
MDGGVYVVPLSWKRFALLLKSRFVVIQIKKITSVVGWSRLAAGMVAVSSSSGKVNNKSDSTGLVGLLVIAALFSLLTTVIGILQRE